MEEGSLAARACSQIDRQSREDRAPARLTNNWTIERPRAPPVGRIRLLRASRRGQGEAKANEKTRVSRDLSGGNAIRITPGCEASNRVLVLTGRSDPGSTTRTTAPVIAFGFRFAT